MHCPLPHLQALSITGEHINTFLQGQLTCDVANLQKGHALSGALCNAQGRVISHLWLWQEGDQCAMVLPKDLADTVMQQLGPAAMLSRITLGKSEKQVWGHIGDCGSECFCLDGALEGMALSLNHDEAETLGNPNLWHQTLLEKGWIEIHEKTCKAFTPHMIHYPHLGLISFDKGCFLGQEIIARTQYLGKTKRFAQMAILKSDCPPSPGDTLMDRQGENIGTVAGAAQCSKQEALLWVVSTEQHTASKVQTEKGMLTWQALPWKKA